MSALPAATAPRLTTPPVTPHGRWRRWSVLSGWAVAGWLAAVAAQAVRVDWVLLVFVVVALAGLVRGGRGPVARVVLAVALLFSGACVAGLLFSVWPWHLAPVPVAGAGFTVLALTYGLTGRRFAIPRPGGDDVAALVGVATVAVVTLWPLVQRGPGARLAIFMHVEDFLRHLLIYDATRTGGGYLFLHEQVALRVTGGGFNTYPTGGHFVFALTENFLRSSSAVGAPGVWADDFVWLFAASYIWLGLAVLWGVRHVAGPAAAGWRSVPVTALVAVLLAFGPPIRIFDRGYPQETTALALVAVLVALLVRPLARTRDQVVLVGALLAGVSFSYYLFLPVVLVFALGWLIAHRRRLLRHRVVVAVTAVGSIAGMAVIPGLNWRYAPPGAVLLQQGQVAPVPLPALAAMVCFAAAAVLAQVVRGRRPARPVGWVGLAGLAASLLFVAGVAAYQRAKGGANYFDVKLQHQLMIVCLVLFGGLAPIAGRLAGWARQRIPALSRPRVGVATTLAVALVPTIAFAAFAPRGAAPGRAYATGLTTELPAAGEYAYRAYAAHPGQDGTVTVILDDSPWITYLSTVYLGIFQHRYPAQYGFAYPLRPWTGQHPLAEVERLAAASPAPVRFYVVDPTTRAELATFAASLPPGKVTVLDPAALR